MGGYSRALNSCCACLPTLVIALTTVGPGRLGSFYALGVNLLLVDMNYLR